MTLLVQRMASVAALAGPALASGGLNGMRPRELATAGALGLFDISANAAFAVATTVGLLSLTAILGSLYPVVTALLARVVLQERLRGVQIAGTAVVLAGVVLITA
jgi:drug/metabolite transporter (DMT)-like permease